jgi:hypothetical protein
MFLEEKKFNYFSVNFIHDSFRIHAFQMSHQRTSIQGESLDALQNMERVVQM